MTDEAHEGFTPRSAVTSHLAFNAGIHDGDPVQLTSDDKARVERFIVLHGRFSKARGAAKLRLLHQMDRLLEDLGLDDCQRRAAIALKESFDIF